jgi:predicted Zn-dependent protease
VALDPAQPAFRMNLAELHARRGDVSAALAVVEVTVASHPEAWWAWERLGELQAARGHYPPARDAFARALALRPGDPAILYKLARAECDCGNPSAADPLLGEAAARAPGHEAVTGLQAELLAVRADWEGLEAQAQRWLARRPGHGPALRWLARARWERGYLTDALDTLRAALHAGPRDVAGLATLARLALLSLDFETAALALEEAETLEPGSPQLLQPRAILSMYRGDMAAAERCARQALQHDGRDVASWKTLVQLCSGRLGATELAALGELAESDALDARDRATAADRRAWRGGGAQ